MSAPRCYYSDPARRGPRSPECFPGTFAAYIVRRYFIDFSRRTRRPLHLCRAHAEHHAHLSPELIKGLVAPADVERRR